MILLTDTLNFPNCNKADEDGVLAIGGDLSVERLLLAYQSGIFPWFNKGEPIVWWSPDPRMVLFTDELRFSKSMKVLFKKETFKVSKIQVTNATFGLNNNLFITNIGFS